MIFWSIVSSLQISVTPLFSYCSCKEGTCSEMFEASFCHQDLGCHSHTKDIRRYYHIIDERTHERFGSLKTLQTNQISSFFNKYRKTMKNFQIATKMLRFQRSPSPFWSCKRMAARTSVNPGTGGRTACDRDRNSLGFQWNQSATIFRCLLASWWVSTHSGGIDK